QFTAQNNTYSYNGMSYTYTYVMTTGVPPTTPIGTNTKRDVMYGFIKDRYGLYDWATWYNFNRSFGSNHAGYYQPVAFADGSVRMMSYLSQDLVTIADGRPPW